MMPCESWRQPTWTEQRICEAAKLLVFVLGQNGKSPQAWLLKEADSYYGTDARVEPMLCEELQQMGDEAREKLVYNAHDPMSRRLATWYEEHQKIDAERRMADQERGRLDRLRASAAAKLSDEERAAIGI